MPAGAIGVPPVTLLPLAVVRRAIRRHAARRRCRAARRRRRAARRRCRAARRPAAPCPCRPSPSSLSSSLLSSPVAIIVIVVSHCPKRVGCFGSSTRFR